MAELRPDQEELLTRHREIAFGRFTEAAISFESPSQLRDTPEGRALLDAPREIQVAIAVSAAAAAVERRRVQQEQARNEGVLRLEPADVFPTAVLDALKRRRLPFTPADVELLLDLGTSTMQPDDVFGRSFETLKFGVSAAASAIRDTPASAPVLGALERAGSALDRLQLVHTSDAGAVRRRIGQLIAANVPGGLLDLSILDGPDAWAQRAADVLRRHVERWDRVADLLGLLAAATTTRPTKSWRRRAAALAGDYDGYGRLLRDLIEPILDIELTPSSVPWPPSWLLAPGNEPLARGAAWALADVDGDWVVPLLGRLALRCAAASPHPQVTTALAYPVASGAVEALAAMDTDASRAELRILLVEIRRRDLVRRIAGTLGEPAEETETRDARLRRDKRREVQQKASPEPKDRQRAASAHVRRDLAPRLREAGFDDSAGRTFWRHLDDRIETIHCKAHAGGLTLEIGIWLRFIPRTHDVPEHDGRPRPGEFHCDIRGNVHAWHEDLESSAEKAELWFARWRPLVAMLGWLLEGTASDDAFCWGAPGSPMRAVVTGYVAREIADLPLASAQLERAATYFRSQLERQRTERPEAVTPEYEAWVSRLEADAL